MKTIKIRKPAGQGSATYYFLNYSQQEINAFWRRLPAAGPAALSELQEPAA